jgi:hypothetical protein
MMLHIRKLGENAGAHLTYKTIILRSQSPKHRNI